MFSSSNERGPGEMCAQPTQKVYSDLKWIFYFLKKGICIAGRWLFTLSEPGFQASKLLEERTSEVGSQREDKKKLLGFQLP
jgi:hypothetical protein